MAKGENREQDLAWVRAVQVDDDRAAFAQLVRAHQAVVRALLRRLCGGDAALADELAQESFLHAWQALPGFRGESRFRTWLFRVAYNVFLQHARRGSERLRRSTDTLDPEAFDAAVLDAFPAATSLSHTVALALDLERALARLSGAEREAIICCGLADLSHSEAALVLGWPLGTVKTHVQRGKAKLREMLAAWAPSSAPERIT